MTRGADADASRNGGASDDVATITRWPMRRVVAAVLAFDLVMLGAILMRATPTEVSLRNAPAFLLWLGGRPSVLVPIVVVGLACAWNLWRGFAPARSGLALLLIGALLNESLATLFGMPMRFLFHGGVVLVGWLAGLCWSRFWWPARGNAANRWHEHVATFGALGALAASYFGAVSSKLLAHGVDWGDARRMQTVVLGHLHFDAPGIIERLAALVVSSPAIATSLAVATLVIQSGAVLLLAGPRIRRLWAVLLIGFHAGVLLLTHILFPQVVVILLALMPPSRDRVAPPGPALPARPGRIAIALAPVALLVIAARTLPAIVWPRQTPGPQSSRPVVDQAPLLPVPPAVRPVVESLAPGQTLAGWRVDSVSGTSDGGALIRVARSPQSLELIVIAHGVRPFEPPAQAAGFDIYTGHALPPDRQPTSTERDALVAAVRAIVMARRALTPGESPTVR